MMLPDSEGLIFPTPLWLVCSETVFYLGNGGGVEAVFNLLSSRPLCGHIQHVSVGWTTFRDLISLCKRLPVFHQMKTFIILIQGEQRVRPLTDYDGEFASLADWEVKGLHASDFFDTNYLGGIVNDFLSLEFKKWSERTPQVNFAVSEVM